MSAIKTAQHTTDRIDVEGLRVLGSFAKQAGLDLNASSEQMFRCSPECLTKQQEIELLRMFLKAKKPLPTHPHYCVECGESNSCDKTGCETNETLCNNCNDGDSSMVRDDYWLHSRQVVMQ
jgi:hypothetical protein